jgi:outer membrane lipoprotein LolB
MTRFAARSAVLFVIGIMLAGCPSMPRRDAVEPQSWDARRTELQARESFALSGRVAVASGQEGFNARLRWEQSGAASEVALDGPLGSGGVRIRSDGANLQVATSRGEELDADSARAEIERRIGFDPPLGSLRYWVLGVPDPASPASEVLDGEARLASLEQDGWRIEYADYAAVDGRWLPKRMTLNHGEVRVRLLVDNWRS